jgi:hypothetical protein
VVYPVRGADPETHDIHIVATDGSGSWPIVQHPEDDRLLGWVPDTDWVLFLSHRMDMWGAWAIRVIDGRAVGAPRLVHPGMGQAHPGGFTEVGDYYYNVPVRWFTTYVAPFDVASMQIDTTHAELIPGSTVWPQWSHDGTRLAFRIEKSEFVGSGYDRPLHVRDVLAGEERELADHLDVRRPHWSPDGRHVLVSANDETIERSDYHGGLYSIDVETGDAELLVRYPQETNWWMGASGVWMADGRSVVYTRNGLILHKELESGRETELYNDPKVATKPFVMSPDGTSLVFRVVDSLQAGTGIIRKGGGRLMIMALPEGTVRELVRLDEPGEVGWAMWTPDGRYLIYPYTEEDGSTLWRVPRQGGEPEIVWQSPMVILGAMISPDGKRIAYETYAGGGREMVMENLKAVLERSR